jgi:plastocyanin
LIEKELAMIKRMIKRWMLIALTILVTAAIVVVACKKKGDGIDPGIDVPTEKAIYKPTGDEGSVSGKTLFEGTPPAPKKIDMGAEPPCAAKNPNAASEEVVVADGKLANVFVYLKGGPITRHSFPASGDPTLDQSGCRYIPHVLGVQVNQNIKILNTDTVNHNVHPTPAKNPEWNESQAAGTSLTKKFGREETLVPVKCNIHPWMKAYIGVLGHPFFAVSSADGSYKIENVPVGDYTLVAWHEKYGEKTEKISVTAKGAITKDFTYGAAQAVIPTSLQVESALILPGK